MKPSLLFTSCLIASMSHAWADSAQFSGEFDQLEARSQGLLLWDGELFFGNASNRALVLKTAAELPNRLLGSHELQLLVQTALNNRWQVRAGVRMDTYPDPTRSWGVVSFTGENALGTALEITGFAHGENQSLLLGAEHVFQLKPRLELIPKAEVVFNSHDDVATSVGAGLSTLELGARLRYHYTAAVKPYVGINWITSYGNSRDLLNAEGARAQNFTLRAGFSWAF